jgi:hypothetical protein
MTRVDLEAKFHGNAVLALPAAQVTRLSRLVAGMATLPRIDALAEALT